MMETRYTPWVSIGSETEAGLLLYEQGPYFEEPGAEPAKFEAECVLPTKRIDGPLLMRREHLTCALIELMQITHTPSRSNGVFHRPPEAFYRIKVVTAVGR